MRFSVSSASASIADWRLQARRIIDRLATAEVEIVLADLHTVLLDDDTIGIRVDLNRGIYSRRLLKVKIDPATLEVVDGSVKRFGDGSAIGTSPETELD